MREPRRRVPAAKPAPLIVAAAVFAVVLGSMWGATSVGAAPTTAPNHDPFSQALQQGGLVISRVTVDGVSSTVTISNVSSDPISLGGLWVCNVPSYWPLPDQTLEPGASITLNAGAGTDTSSQFFAGGAFGSLGSPGEIALYNAPEFDSPDAILAYVGWNGGSGRRSVAQAAGIWGDEDVSAEVGDTIRRTSTEFGAAAYSAGEAATVAALPSTGSGGLADDVGGHAAIVWASVAGIGTLLVGIGARRVRRRRA